MTDILWTPNPETSRQTAMARFMAAQGFALQDYVGLHRWSTSDPGAFWAALWDFCAIPGERGQIAFVPDEAQWMTGARFFPQAQVNFAEVMLAGAPDEIVVHTVTESGDSSCLTRGALTAQVARVAEGLLRAGVSPGDRVAGILPNTAEALVALLATAAVGGIWTSCSPDFGTIAIVDRLGQVAPKVLFAAAHYDYGGKSHDIASRLTEVLGKIPSIKVMVLSGAQAPVTVPDQVMLASQADFGQTAPFAPLRLPFDHPLYILYTSGTTGAPKAIVHRAGGVVVQHLKEHVLHGDVRPGDALLWYTNTAWMMYHWMVSVLGCGAAVVLYDGAPILKGADGLDCAPLWKAVETKGVTHLGISPKYLQTLAAEGYYPAERVKLPRFRALMSAGAPVMPAQYDWVYAHVKADMMFASISGGTEILGCFLIGSPLHPVRRGQLTVPALGHAMAVLDERNAPVIGRRGALVCTEPFPSMPLTFWGEGGWDRYMATYFADQPEVWTHGDVAELTATGGGYVHGRADSTLKPGGVRIGTSEIYAVCDSFAEIADCVVFGAQHDGDEEVVLCIKPTPGAMFGKDLVKAIRARIRAEVSPRHVPARIHLVAEIPMTINGKRVEGAARTAVADGVVKNLGSLQNPGCLDEYRGLQREASL